MFDKLKKRIINVLKATPKIKGLWIIAPTPFKHPNSYKFGSDKQSPAYFYETNIGFVPCRFIFIDGYGRDPLLKIIKFRKIDLKTQKPKRYIVSHGDIVGIEFTVERNDLNV